MSEQVRGSSREEAARQQLLRIMALVTICGGLLFVVITLVLWWIGQDSIMDTLGAMGITLVGLLVLGLNRGKHLRVAGLVLAALLMLAPTYYVILEGPKTVAILFFVGGFIYTDFLLGSWGGLIAAAVECLLYLGAGLAHLLGWFPGIASDSPFVGDLVTVVVVCFALALTAGFFTREMRRALQSYHDQEETLHAANEDRDHLLAEIKVREEGQRLLLERVHELGSPIIPLSAGVIAMPIIGVVEGRRVEEIMGAFLQGIEAHRARFALVDITGVPVVDAPFGASLLQMVDGARLLGAEPILTGVGPVVAETLVNLDLDFTPVTAQATLQEGLEYALRQQNPERNFSG